MDSKSYVERLIDRVRTLIDMGLTLDEIVEVCSDVKPRGEVWLAWHAANILIGDRDACSE